VHSYQGERGVAGLPLLGHNYRHDKIFVVALNDGIKSKPRNKVEFALLQYKCTIRYWSTLLYDVVRVGHWQCHGKGPANNTKVLLSTGLPVVEPSLLMMSSLQHLQYKHARPSHNMLFLCRKADADCKLFNVNVPHDAPSSPCPLLYV
jgi:hypothetical protein